MSLKKYICSNYKVSRVLLSIIKSLAIEFNKIGVFKSKHQHLNIVNEINQF